MNFLRYLSILEDGLSVDMNKLIHEDVDEKTGGLLSLGKKIADELKIIFNGIWDSELGKLYLTFTDPKTKSTFISVDRDETVNNLKLLRARYD